MDDFIAWKLHQCDYPVKIIRARLVILIGFVKRRYRTECKIVIEILTFNLVRPIYARMLVGGRLKLTLAWHELLITTE